MTAELVQGARAPVGGLKARGCGATVAAGGALEVSRRSGTCAMTITLGVQATTTGRSSMGETAPRFCSRRGVWPREVSRACVCSCLLPVCAHLPRVLRRKHLAKL